MKSLLKNLLPPSLKDLAMSVSPPTVPRNMRKILHLDDDVYTCQMIATAAEKFFTQLVSVHSVREARLVADTSAPTVFDLFILDVVLSNGSGVDFYKYISSRWPQSRVVFLTGRRDFETREAIERTGPATILTKDKMYEESFLQQLFLNSGMLPRDGSTAPFG